jgi:hypothetical protein
MSKHLKNRNIHYVPHLIFAFGAGIVLLKASIISILHAILPDFMPDYAERKTMALARLARMKNGQYRTKSRLKTNNQ